MKVRVKVLRKTRDRMHVVEQLGATQSLTPEGYLLCECVPIARVGVMVYGPGETPVAVGADKLARIERTADEVFRDTAVHSFEGKPVTNDHPPEDVSPDNFKTYVVGITQNVRRGAGIDSDLLVADLIIHDKDAIEAVREGKREVSCGYDADYEQIEPGRGRQLNIMGNHVALVKNGRAGARCAIQDRSLLMKEKDKSVLAMLQRAFKAKDSAELEKIAEEMGEDGDGTQVHVHVGAKTGDESTTDARLDRIEKAIAALTKDKKSKDDKEDGDDDGDETKDEESEEEDDKDKKAKDRKRAKDKKAKDEEECYTGEMSKAKDTAARLEILVPGTKIPVRDGQQAAGAFLTALLETKRKVLDTASSGEHKDVLSALVKGQDLSKASHATVDALLIAGAEIVKAKNNSAGARSGVSTKDFGRATTAADMNAKNREFWATRGAK